MVYDVKENSPVMKAVELLDCLFRRYDTKAMTESKIPHILDAPDGGFDERRQIFYSSLKLLLTLLSQEKPIPFSNDDSINNALAYIRKNYMNPITVSDLARECGFAPNYFIRRFKSVMKQTPYSYLRAYRLLCVRIHFGGCGGSRRLRLCQFPVPRASLAKKRTEGIKGAKE